MKKTIFLMALGLGSLCLTSCSRGYGCGYTIETKIQNPEKKNLKANDSQLIAKELETTATELIAD